jgi:hypothetical protein
VVNHSSGVGVFLMKVQMRLREPWKIEKSDRTPVLAEPTCSTTAAGSSSVVSPASRRR